MARVYATATGETLAVRPSGTAAPATL